MSIYEQVFTYTSRKNLNINFFYCVGKIENKNSVNESTDASSSSFPTARSDIQFEIESVTDNNNNVNVEANTGASEDLKVEFVTELPLAGSEAGTNNPLYDLVEESDSENVVVTTFK